MLRTVHSELDLLASIAANAALHASALLADEWIQQDLDVYRDAHHLRARVESTARQIDDALRTLKRLEARYQRTLNGRRNGYAQPEQQPVLS
ncbi:MAG: hypothetical protein D6685_12945 [Bacteroidetes bacterium]|nr:hypothetical protein AWN76_004180 [Rhodothermaceae bacterium RA]RMH56919.1 MAG: hypothetical protein D6685_12945 [Bacteroidota bacterium]